MAQPWAWGVAGGPSILRAGAGLMAARPLLVCLQDSVLAFWSHGMQGRSLDTNEVSGTQEPGCPPPGCPHVLGVASVPLFFPGDPGDHRQDEDLPSAWGPQVGGVPGFPFTRPPRPHGHTQCLPALLTSSSLSPQRHHPREHSHRQPRGSQQPLHSHGPSEQLLSGPGTPLPRPMP